MKDRIKTVCKQGATGTNRKQRRANAVKAYKRVMDLVKRGTIDQREPMETTEPMQGGNDTQGQCA